MENKVREMEGFVEILAKKRKEVLGIMAHNHRTGKVLPGKKLLLPWDNKQYRKCFMCNFNALGQKCISCYLY